MDAYQINDYVVDRSKAAPITADMNDRLTEGFSMFSEEFEDHGGVFEDHDVYYPWLVKRIAADEK